MPFDYAFVMEHAVLSDADKERMVCILLNATVSAGELPVRDTPVIPQISNPH